MIQWQEKKKKDIKNGTREEEKRVTAIHRRYGHLRKGTRDRRKRTGKQPAYMFLSTGGRNREKKRNKKKKKKRGKEKRFKDWTDTDWQP